MANRITLPEIAAVRLVGIDLSTWEVEAVLVMDAAWMGGQKPADAPTGQVAQREMTPALFDALF